MVLRFGFLLGIRSSFFRKCGGMLLFFVILSQKRTVVIRRFGKNAGRYRQLCSSS